MHKNGIDLEDALILTGFGKFNVSILLLCGTILVGMIFETLGLSFIIPAAQCDLSLTTTQKGWLGAIPFAAIILTSHMWGWLADTKGRRPVIMCAMTIASIFSVISSLSPNLWTFAILRFITGIFAAGPSSVIYAYLGEFNSAKYRDKVVTIGASFISVGTVVMTGVSWMIFPTDFRLEIDFLGIDFRPWRLLVIICALPYIVSSVIMLNTPESPKFLISLGKDKETLDVLRLMYRWNNGGKMDPFEGVALEGVPEKKVAKKSSCISVLKSMWHQTVPLFQKPLLHNTLIACFGQFAVFATSNGFYLWLPEILNKLTNVSPSEIPNNLCGHLTFNTSQVLMHDDFNDTRINIPVCDDTINPIAFRNAIMISSLLLATLVFVSCLVNVVGKKAILVTIPMITGLSSLAINFSTDRNISLVLFAVVQICGGSIGMMNAVIVEVCPTHLRAMAVCLSMMFGRSGSILGANLIGYLIESHCESSFYLVGGLLIACSGVCALIRIPNKSTNINPITT